MRRTLLALSLLLGACQHVPRGVVDDPSMAAVEAKYLTAEMRAKGQTFIGAGITDVLEGQPYNDVKLEVQGYLDGTITVDSTRCKYSQSFEYTKSGSVAIDIPGVAKESCIFTVTVIPRMDKLSKSANLSYELRGQFLIKMVPLNKLWYGVSDRVARGADPDIVVPSFEGDARTYFRGCDTFFNHVRSAGSGGARIFLSELMSVKRDVDEVPECIFEGAAFTTPRVQTLTWAVYRYKEAFSPLPLPQLITTDQELEVYADPATSVILLDTYYVVDNRATMAFNRSENHTLRLLTVKGRTSVCLWDAGEQRWTCLN